MSFETEVFLYTSNGCSSLYSMLYNTPFSKVRPAAYTMYNSLKIGLVLRELMIEILYVMDAI